MTKSYVSFFLGLYNAILADSVCQYPYLAVELRRDQKRLSEVASKRGEHLFTIDLPAIGKEFEANLKIGYISIKERLIPVKDQFTDLDGTVHHCQSYTRVPDVLPLHGKRARTMIPRLFGGLWSLVFDANTGKLLNDPDVNAIFFLRQLYYAAKKVELQCPDTAVFAAVEEFVKIEEMMRHPTNDWLGDYMVTHRGVHLCDELTRKDLPLFKAEHCDDPSAEMIQALNTCQHVADSITSEFGEFEPAAWSFKHGPGVVADAKKGDKYLFPTWPSKLETTFPSSDFAFANYSEWAEWVSKGHLDGRLSHHEVPSKLICVPKTQKGPRLIAAEPTSHQWCQQAIRAYLESSVARTVLACSINFKDQAFSRYAALTASRDRKSATIDLSSASDRLSLWTVERMFRANPSLLLALHSARTRWLVNNIDKKQPKFIKLRKFAAQGAAVTFPVQTIIYTLIAIGVGLSVEYGTGNNGRYTRKQLVAIAQGVRVFGDDIIVPNSHAGILIEVLQYLGLSVNIAKSFTEGNFRESCGMDAYDGYDVTPAYLRRIGNPSQPESIDSVVECSNNFFKKGLWHAAHYLQSQVMAIFKLKIPVVSSSSGLFGWTSFCGNDYSELKSRWNRDLQSEQYLSHTPVGVVKKGSQSGESSLHQFFTEVKPYVSSWSDHLRDPQQWSHGWIARAAVKIRLRWSLLA